MKKDAKSNALATAARELGTEIRTIIGNDQNASNELAKTMGMPTGDDSADHAGLILVAAAAATETVNPNPSPLQRNKAIFTAANSDEAQRPPFIQQLAKRILSALNGKNTNGRHIYRKNTNRLMKLAEKGRATLANTPGNGEHDFRGRALQKITPHRRQRGNYHSSLTTATLMANLVLPDSTRRPGANIRVADYSCGSGALLVAAARRLDELEHSGNPPPEQKRGHRFHMHHVLTGLDTSPAALTLAAENLADLHPEERFTRTMLAALPYGPTGEGGHALGALELLMGSNSPEKPPAALARQGAKNNMPPDCFRARSQDAVIMNPPFAGPNNHQAMSTGPTTPEDIQHTAKRFTELSNRIQTHSNFGPGYHFAMLACRNVRRGGRIALVVPVTALTGVHAGQRKGPGRPGTKDARGWPKFRNTLLTDFAEITVISSTHYKEQYASFSDDSLIAETIITARRLKPQEKPTRQVTFVNIAHMPKSEQAAKRLAHSILGARLTAETTGNATLDSNENDVPGHATTISPAINRSWPMSRILNQEMIQAITNLEEGRITLGNLESPIQLTLPEQLPMTTLNSISDVGNVEFNPKPSPRKGESPDNPVHRVHLKGNFRFNSQSTLACVTNQTVRKSGWAPVTFHQQGLERAAVLWLNTTPGLINHWANSRHTQDGLSLATKSQLASMPFLDLRALSSDQVERMNQTFDQMAEASLMPASEAWQDPIRRNIDHVVLREILGTEEKTMQELELLRAKWCQEPTVQGKKGITAPQAQKMERLRAEAESAAEAAEWNIGPQYPVEITGNRQGPVLKTRTRTQKTAKRHTGCPWRRDNQQADNPTVKNAKLARSRLPASHTIRRIKHPRGGISIKAGMLFSMEQDGAGTPQRALPGEPVKAKGAQLNIDEGTVFINTPRARRRGDRPCQRGRLSRGKAVPPRAIAFGFLETSSG